MDDTPTFPDYFVGWKIFGAIYARPGRGAFPQGEHEPVLSSPNDSIHVFSKREYCHTRCAGYDAPAYCDTMREGVGLFSGEWRPRVKTPHETPLEECNCGYGMFHDPYDAMEWGCLGGCPPMVLCLVRAWGEVIAFDETARCQYIEPIVSIDPKTIRYSLRGYRKEPHPVEGVEVVSFRKAKEMAKTLGISLAGWTADQ